MLLGFFVFAMLVLLLVQGVSTHTLGSSGTRSPEGRGVRGLSTVLASQDGRLRSRSATPGRRVALSFDDGPDSRWTPAIARELRGQRVPATFFVTGSQAAAHPEVVRRLHRDGFELGNHTFTHADLSAIPSWERSLQLGTTESVVSGITGVRMRLVRPPYTSTPDAVRENQRLAFEQAANRGYVIALSDFDGKDWARPGVEQIVEGATPPGKTGGIVLLHDGGGDRSETLQALRQLIPALRRRGFEFVPVSTLAGLGRPAAEPQASWIQRSRGHALIGVLAVADVFASALTAALVVVAVLSLLRALVLFVFARRHTRRIRSLTGELLYAPPASIVVPAFNEAVVIERAVRSLAASDYAVFEVVVVDDGSSDGTAALVEALGLEGVRVIRQPNAGKPAALNRGAASTHHDLLVTVDADTVFESGTLARLVAPFRDERVGAVAGNTKVGNRRGLLGRWQHIEYVMGFNLDRRLYDELQCMPTVPGAIGAFRREAMDEVGGVSAATLAEDTDLTIAIGRHGWRVVYAEDARAWTEAPGSLGELWRQRYRWCYGTMQSLWKHRAALRGRDEGPVGRRGLPYLALFQVLLPLLAPLVDLYALYGIVFLDPVPVVGYWLAFNALQTLLGWYAFRLDQESPRALWAMPLQQFVYRQLMYLVVIESVVSALLGTRLHWQHLERSGDIEAPA